MSRGGSALLPTPAETSSEEDQAGPLPFSLNIWKQPAPGLQDGRHHGPVGEVQQGAGLGPRRLRPPAAQLQAGANTFMATHTSAVTALLLTLHTHQGPVTSDSKFASYEQPF